MDGRAGLELRAAMSSSRAMFGPPLLLCNAIIAFVRDRDIYMHIIQKYKAFIRGFVKRRIFVLLHVLCDSWRTSAAIRGEDD